MVPDKAIDQCKGSYKAADGQKQKMAMDNFDDSGVMVLTSAKHFVLDSSAQSCTEPQSPQASPFWTTQSR